LGYGEKAMKCCVCGASGELLYQHKVNLRPLIVMGETAFVCEICIKTRRLVDILDKVIEALGLREGEE